LNRLQAALQSIALVATNGDDSKSRHGARRRAIVMPPSQLSQCASCN
jgi:hypothetical protein